MVGKYCKPVNSEHSTGDASFTVIYRVCCYLNFSRSVLHFAHDSMTAVCTAEACYQSEVGGCEANSIASLQPVIGLITLATCDGSLDPKKYRWVQKLDRINLDHQSGSDRLGLTRIIEKIKLIRK